MSLSDPDVQRRIMQSESVEDAGRWSVLPLALGRLEDGGLVRVPPILTGDEAYGEAVDRPMILEGRPARPGHAEGIASDSRLREQGLDVGDVITL